ncbi:MAG TPA: RNA polymerase sigma factor SigZ [Thermoflexales bacterium]|nr:RNA polymerase sigma factor SigZ [Thermoflexales bacterium]HQW35577.1 RNA polymerase sigma factor SigZ [Thermoflexales bacterium]
MINIEPATAADQSAITQMLQESHLIYEDLTPPYLAHFLVARVDGALAGAVGLELFGAVGLLRSLVVRASLRGRGYGQALVAALERYALGAGARELFLLTETAPDFFARLGYQKTPRAEAPAPLQATSEFAGLCPQSAICMKKMVQPSAEDVWNELAAPLRKFILKRVNNEGDADDILQNVFMRIHSHLALLDDAARLESWAYQIARNAIIDFYRARKPIIDLEEISVWDEHDDDEIRDCMLKSMQTFIAYLPDGYREAVELEAQGVPQKEIATHLGLSVSGAKSRVQRGRGMVKELFNTCCEYQFDRYGKVIDYRRKK